MDVYCILSRQEGVFLWASASCAARRREYCHVHPRLRPAALSGVNCTAYVKPLRGLARWDYCPAFAMTLRARARPTVGAYGPVQWHLPSAKDLCTLSIRGKCEEKFCIFADSKKMTFEKENLLTGFYGFYGRSVLGSD